ncbi:MAG: OmpA family protein [Clostridiales bacterium]|jgi:chemotaxis protein MotB|nr:OmpA family protein [Clostridiales bacterium]
MKKKKRDSGGGGSWLDTYADMVTLLLTFFVLLFSMSTVEQAKWEALIESLRGSNPSSDVVIDVGSDVSGSGYPDISNGDSELPDNINDMYKYLEKKLEQAGEGQIEVEQGENGEIYITFSDNALFEANQFAITERAKPFLNLVGEALKNVEDKLTLIEAAGYVADTKNPNSTVNDWYLSSNRAASVINYLSDNYQVKYDLLVAIGHGINDPIGDNNTDAGRKKNRRVVLTIVGDDENALSSAAGGNGYDKNKYPAGGNGLTSGSPIVASSAASSAASSLSSGVSPYED